jgi:hypothetical protein
MTSFSGWMLWLCKPTFTAHTHVRLQDEAVKKDISMQTIFVINT